MSSSKIKALVIVFALLLATGFVTTGCKEKTKTGWVNTNSMPGHALSNRRQKTKPHNSKIVYLGSTSTPQRGGFGPHDPSFDFERLR